MGCHCGQHTLQFNLAVAESCNSYFANTFKRTIDKYKNPAQSVDIWANHVKSFGLGQFLGTDMPIGAKGLVPTSKTYKRAYPNGGWRSNTIISNAIGQGELTTSTIQLANMMAAVANQGYFYTPHIVKKIKGQKLDKRFTTKHYTTIDQQFYPPIIQGLADVYNFGTAFSLRVPDLQICGKTGTAENKIRVGGKTYQLEDHSIFVAFAPKENPTIAIAVVVEHGHWGNTWAGPIATLMLEKYINGKITRTDLETRMLNQGLQFEYNKVENIILQRIPIRKKATDTLQKSEPQIGEAKKEEESN
jgi:penicillin-binding protein 2